MSAKPAKKIGPESEVRVVPLGGLGEIGLNLLILEARPVPGGPVEAALVIDCGVMFPTAETPGVDKILPDMSYLLGLGDRVLGVIVTHGHEDHIGGLPWLLRERNVPVYGTSFTLGLIARRLEEHELENEVELVEIEPGTEVEIGPFGILPFAVTHSIADACGFAIRTPVGIVVHTGDFKIDHTPVDGRLTDLSLLSSLGDEGVALLLSDSTNAPCPGTTPSEKSVVEGLEAALRMSPARVLVTTFSSHVHRVQQIVDLSRRTGRRVAFVGRSMETVATIAQRLGKLDVPHGMLVDDAAIPTTDPDRLTIVATGSQGEPRSALARIANGDHRHVRIVPGDTVIFSARVIPGSERPVANIVNHLSRRGARILSGGEGDLHTSGHASRDELALVFRLVRPAAFVPLHGEMHHLVEHSRLAMDVGMAPESIFLLEDGEPLSLFSGRATRAERVPSGRVFVDGGSGEDVHESVLRDRRRLGRDGVVFAMIGIHAPGGEIVSGPEVVSKGVGEDDVTAEAVEFLREILAETPPEERSDPIEAKELVRRGLRRFYRSTMDRRPMIVPFVVEM